MRIATHWKVWLSSLVLMATFWLTGFHMYSTTDHLRIQVSRNATLVQAYEYDERCGSKGRYNCSAYKGRFLVEPEHVYVTKEIDGFFYHSYVDKGRKDMASYVSVSKIELGKKIPDGVAWWRELMIFGCVFFVSIFFFGGIMCLFADEEERDRRRRGW